MHVRYLALIPAWLAGFGLMVEFVVIADSAKVSGWDLLGFALALTVFYVFFVLAPLLILAELLKQKWPDTGRSGDSARTGNTAP